VVIVGGGVLGLWAAKYAMQAGLDVVLVDKNKCGNGGSYGLLGALAPHLPNASNEKKRFQLLALDELPELVATLEEQTGLSTGYGRSGRLMPIRLAGFQKRVDRCVREAPVNWSLGKRRYDFRQIDVQPYKNWINPERAPMGLAFDNLSARAAPRLVTAALKASIRDEVTIIEDFAFGHFDEATGQVVSADKKQSLETKNIVLSAGYQTYGLLKPLTGLDLGHGVKGHSALFRLDGVADQPMLYDNGVYVVPHANGTVAVGSSSQNEWVEEQEVEEQQCSSFLERARELCPALNHAQLLGLWAGVRPRCFAKDPLVGRLANRNIFVLTGGFKISFGIAHRLARALVERLILDENPVALPQSYEVLYHLGEAKKTGRRGE
jgi:glycine/D-amino acid oxidase-like deaminating enzyme